MSLPKISVITHFPSPYQVELFNAIAATGAVNLGVVYLQADNPQRKWAPSKIAHEAIFLNDVARETCFIDESDMVVFNFYRHPEVAKWLKVRSALKTPFAFWGERLGFKLSHILG